MTVKLFTFLLKFYKKKYHENFYELLMCGQFFLNTDVMDTDYCSSPGDVKGVTEASSPRSIKIPLRAKVTP